MTSREAQIRERLRRALEPSVNGGGVSREFQLLSVDDTEYLLAVLDETRMKLPTVTLSRSEVEEVKALLRGDKYLPRETALFGDDVRLSDGLLAKFK